jgi:hypothetical protein
MEWKVLRDCALAMPMLWKSDGVSMEISFAEHLDGLEAADFLLN